jgi:hypothetical protein
VNETVEKWLAELTEKPSVSINKLILGYAGVVAWSGSSLRESFIEICKTHKTNLDEAVAGWLEQHLSNPSPEDTPENVWASHLQDLFSGIAGLGLPQTEKLLHDRLDDFRSWLHPFCKDESLDPEATYLSTLALAKTNQGLETVWKNLTLQAAKESAFYNIDIGLLGLLKTRDSSGNLSKQVPIVFLATLIELADSGKIPEKKWKLLVMSYMGSKQYSKEEWLERFKIALNSSQNAQNARAWLAEIAI